MKHLLSLLLAALLLTLSACGSQAPAETVALTPRATPNSARSNFEVLGRVEQVEQEFLILTLYLYEPEDEPSTEASVEASGETSDKAQKLAQLQPSDYIPGYEVRAIQLPQNAAFYRADSGALTESSVWDIAVGDVVGAASDDSGMSIVLYE